jgi:hypothetical protein
MNKKKYCIAVFCVDGFQSEIAGVGVIASNFVRNFESIIAGCGIPGSEIALYCASPFLAESAIAWSGERAAWTRSVCERSGGKFLQFPGAVEGREQLDLWNGCPPDISTQQQWDSCNTAAANILQKLSHSYTYVFAFLHDVCFIQVPCLVADLKNVWTIWFPHSTSIDFQDEWDKERIAEERSYLSALRPGRNFIGALSPYTEKSLSEKYTIKKTIFKPFYNRIDSSRYDKFTSIANIGSYRRPGDKKLLFMWGRCVKQKGFADVLPWIKDFLHDNRGYHLILLFPTETSNPAYVKQVFDVLSSFDENTYTIYNRFDYDLPLKMLAHPNLSFVILPSLFESMGLTALEAIEFTSGNVIILYRNIPPFKDTLNGSQRALAFGSDEEISILLEKSKYFSGSGSADHDINSTRLFLTFSDQYTIALKEILNEVINK